MEYCVLGSGSGGNAVLVAEGETKVLIDAGLSARQLTLRLRSIGVEPSDLAAVLLTHEHSDHISGLRVLRKQHRLPVYCQQETVPFLKKCKDLTIIESGSAFQIGPITFLPFSVPHDAHATVGFRMTAGDARLGLATDIGVTTTLIEERLRDLDALIIEANHDATMLWDGPYPWPLKQRIAGRGGHLSNDHCGALLAKICGPRLRQITLAHLSEENNDPSKALDTVAEQLNGWSGELDAARQDRPQNLCRVTGSPGTAGGNGADSPHEDKREDSATYLPTDVSGQISLL